MEFIKDYWWLIMVLLLVGFLLNGIRDLKKINYKHYIDKRKGAKRRSSNEDEDDDFNSPHP